MTSKERVKAAIARSQTDRVPTHMNASTFLVEKLKRALGVSTDRELLDSLNIDTWDTRGVDIHHGTMPDYKGPPDHPTLNRNWKGNIVALWGLQERIFKTASGTIYSLDTVPLRDVEGREKDIEDMRTYQWPDPDWFDYSLLKEKLLLYEDRYVIASGISVWQHPTFVRGLDTLLIDMVESPEKAIFLFEIFTEFYCEFFSRILDAAGDCVDALSMADDLGTQGGLLISPEMFETYIASNIRRIASLAHQHKKALIFHSCGNILPLIPKLIELGVDILDPLQPEAMDPFEVKRLYGKDLVLRGGISTQDLLLQGSPKRIREEVFRFLDVMTKDGGYIFSPGHPVLQDDVPVENVVSLYEAASLYQG